MTNNPPIANIQGEGFPTSAQGVNGAYYLQNDSTPPMIWGPKCNNQWGWVRVAIDNSEWTRAVPIPGSPVAHYKFDDVDETSIGMGYVRNLVSNVPMPQGLIAAPKNMFQDTGTFVAENGATASAPLKTYVDVNTGTTGYYRAQVGAMNWPAGDYTLVVDAERNAGSDQTFQFGIFGISMDTVVATNTRQRFVHTVSIPGGATYLPMIVFNNGGVAANVRVWEFNVFPGNADLEPTGVEYGGHIALNNRPFEGVTVEDGYVDCAGKSGFIMWEDSNVPTINAVTFGAFVQTLTVPSFNSLISGYDDYVNMDYSLHNPVALDRIGWVNCAQNGVESPMGDGPILINGASPENSGWRSYIMRMGTNGENLYMINDNVMITGTKNASHTPTDFTAWMFNGTTSTLFAGNNYFSEMVLYNSELDADATLQLNAALTENARANNLIRQKLTRIIVPIGDSITRQGLFDAMGSTFDDPANVLKYAIGGFTLADLYSVANYYDEIVLSANTNTQAMQLNILIGANDLTNGYTSPYGGGTGATGYSYDLLRFAQQRKAVGWTVILSTILPRTGVIDFNTNRAIVNADIVAAVGNQCDYCLNLAADPVMGPDAACLDNSLYYDGLHPTVLGYTYLNADVLALYNSIPNPI